MKIPNSIAPLLLLALTACTQSSPTAPPAPFPVVSTPPIAQTVYPGMSATFSVEAQGVALSYQWCRGGVAIPGATASTWTTGPLKGPEDSAEISVIVDNGGTRFPEPFKAALTVRPPLDLRFKGIGESLPSSGGVRTNVPSGMMFWGSPSFGIPLSVGAATAQRSSWDLAYWGLAPGLRGTGTRYGALWFDNFEEDMASFTQGDGVITSLDLGQSHNIWAFSLLSTEQSGSFQPLLRGSVTLEGLQDFVSKEGAQGRVITAISFGSNGQPYVLSYGWSLAPSARFEARALQATPDTLVAAALELSAQGYTLTALGADNERGQGLLLVGTRPEGSTKPRELLMPGQTATGTGWTNLGHVWDPKANGWIWLVQR